jgi:hypothetical protein
MHDAGKIIVGLVIFLAIVTSPIWYHSLTGADPGPPELRITSESPDCVAPTPYMRALHMDLLNQWRQDSVRTEDATYVGLGGKVYQKSLSGTCLSCHSNKGEFCDRCHEYVGVKPYCWDCHLEPPQAPARFSQTRIWGQ